MAVISFYGDESADMNERVFAYAGYVSTVDEWDEFSKEWLSVTHDPRWPSPISEFHAADCAAQRGEFAGWEQPQCTELMIRLVDVIVNPRYVDMYGTGSVVMLEDLGRPDPTAPESLKRIKDGYTMTGAMIFLNVAGRRLSRQHREAIEFIFDGRKEVRGHVLRLFEVLEKPGDRELVSELKGRLSFPIFRCSRNTPPLQAADLLVWETQKHAFNHRYDPHKIRRSLERLIQGRRHRGAHITREFIEEIQRKDKAGEDLHDLPYTEIYRDFKDV